MKYFFLIAFSIFLFACTEDNKNDLGQDCDIDTVSYASDIQPIFTNSCAFSGCHKGSVPASGINLENHAEASKVSGSLLLASIKHESGASPMPKSSSKLPACSIEKIEIWVEDGKPNN